MAHRELRLDLLLNRRVRDANGKVVGRLEEVVADVHVGPLGSRYEVREYHVGKYALFEALAGGAFARAVLRLVGRGRGYRRVTIPWQWMDLSDWQHPRTTKRLAELERASEASS